MFQIERDDLKLEYQCYLASGNESFQWTFQLSRIIEGAKIYVVKNRAQLAVGPTFKTREQGSNFLGYSGKNADVVANRDRLIEEYDNLFSDEVETRLQSSNNEGKKFGRPSQGRSERLQFSTTRDVAEWISSQSQGDESVSETIHRLLETMKG